ncbi:META domain-containing protein [Paenarthrobacter nitroguajacolicus]|uniref:META domain-containing protein n=1 Tax=Paenarthrobacter nitroguajacolicus TaxID=211146 RepID=UPI00286BF71D|nr:META domain-containing protein [Paenarthrobacter nitroguajacolicus]
MSWGFFLGASLSCGLLLAGCAQTINSPDVTAVSSSQPGTALQPATTLQPGAAEQPYPTQGPETPCEGGPLGCAEYTTVRGTDATGNVAWLESEPLRVSSRHANGQWTLFVHTPCNHLQVAVSVQANVMTQLWMAATDRGCEGPTASYQAWTEKLFEQPVQWKLDGDVLTLRNSHATIEFKES